MRVPAEFEFAEPLVLAETRGSVRLLTFNRPDRLNAWTPALEERYFALLAEADDDPEVRAIVVTGAGRGFCAGGDTDVLTAEAAEPEGGADGRRDKSFALAVRKPTIAAINGGCAGLGLVQALMCDVRFAARDAKITTAFARRGLIAEHGISWLLPRVVGRGRALDLLISGRVLTGAEALEVGLVEFVSDGERVVSDAIEYAQDIAMFSSPAAVAAIRDQVTRDFETDLTEALANADELLSRALRWPDFAEGVASFVERRRPRFQALEQRRDG